MAVQIQLRRGSASEWTSANPVLAQGEIGLELDSGKIKAGDGVLAWNALPYVTGTQGPQGIQGEQGLQGEQGDAGPQGIQGIQGPPGADGVGIPNGGTAGQYLRKASGTNYDTAWSALLDADIPSSIARDSEVSAAITAHEASGNPHPAYATDSDLSNHVAASDPHAGYQRESEKGAANGYPGLGAGATVPVGQLATGTPDGTKFLRDDGTWATPAGGGGGGNGYVLNLAAASLSAITDAATYFFGALAGLAPQTTAALASIYVTKAGTIKAAEVLMRSATVGTAENISVNIRINNTTDTLIQTVGTTTNPRRFTNTALNIAVALGDRIEIKVVCPTWATNPATVAFGGNLYVE